MTTTTRLPSTSASVYPTRIYDWRDEASCSTVDPEIFFPTGPGGLSAQQERNAKKVCGNCPVRQQCLEWALQTGQHTGVWGGLSEKERRGRSPVRESTMTLCMNRQAWIEGRIADGASQKQIARELGVDSGVLSRAIRRFNAERAVAGEQVSA